MVEREATPAYVRPIWTAVGAIILLWFLAKFTGTFILFFFFVLVLAITMNVVALERRRVPRLAGPWSGPR